MKLSPDHREIIDLVYYQEKSVVRRLWRKPARARAIQRKHAGVA